MFLQKEKGTYYQLLLRIQILLNIKDQYIHFFLSKFIIFCKLYIKKDFIIFAYILSTLQLCLFTYSSFE